MKVEVLQKVADLLNSHIKEYQAEISELEAQIIKLEQRLDNAIAKHHDGAVKSEESIKLQSELQKDLHASEEKMGDKQHNLYAITEERLKYDKVLQYCKDMAEQQANIDEKKVLEILGLTSFSYLEKIVEDIN